MFVVYVSTELGEYCQLEMFHASCAPGHVVVMTSAVYGRMRIGRCVRQDYGFIGCSADVLRYADRLCSGRQICQFPVAELHGNQPCPDDLTPYLEASYQCLPGNCHCQLCQLVVTHCLSLCSYASASLDYMDA